MNNEVYVSKAAAKQQTLYY